MVKICTYNARGLRDNVKRKQLMLLLKHKKLDVIFVQETHALQQDEKIWRAQWGCDIIFANASSHSKGVMIMIRKGLDCIKSDSILDETGRFIITEVNVEDVSLILCTVYAPNIDTPSFFLNLIKHIETMDNPNLIIGGDFNFAVDPKLDCKFSHHNNDKARDTFLKFAEECELSNVWRTFHPDLQQFSCCRPNSDSDEWSKFSRLDMFFISNGLLNSVIDCKMQSGFQSDHSFVIMELNLTGVKRGPGYWKFNTSHLRDKQFVTAANAIIDEFLQESLEPDVKWELLKGKFIEFSKQYSIDKAKDKAERLKSLELKLDMLKQQIESSVIHNTQLLKDQLDVQNELNSYMRQKALGALIRSRTKFFEQGERSSKYYFALEKHRAKLKHMKLIRLNDGSIIKDSTKILQEQTKFYRNLYTSKLSLSCLDKLQHRYPQWTASPWKRIFCWMIYQLHYSKCQIIKLQE